MKIIHCADIHLGSKMESRLPKELAEERRGEVLATFSRMIEYAKANGVSAIMLSGDIFDSDRPLKKDKQFFYDAVKSNPQIDFLYLRGNHDRLESYTERAENLKTFSGEWKSYYYDNIAISGIEISPENRLSLYSTLRLNPKNINLVMMHGQAGTSAGDDINLLGLADKNIDYLALGHIHSLKSGRLDARGVYAYSGCLEGRGFDEAGEKGFILLEITDKITSTFIPFARRTIAEFRVDISTAANPYESFLKVKSAINCTEKDLVSVILTGEAGFDSGRIDKDLEAQLAPYYYFVSVKDDTRRKIDIDKLVCDISLKGEFIRCVMASGYSEAEKREIIAAGLKALEGREAEL